MKSIDTWLEEYGASHQNPINKAIHWVCVPLIFFSICGFFYSVKLPFSLPGNEPMNLAVIMLTLVTIYYYSLSNTLWLGMSLFGLGCYGACMAIASAGIPVWAVSAAIFVGAWIVQFYGHKVEGAKPSFLKDLQFLMIGPAWLMSFIYKRLNISY